MKVTGSFLSRETTQSDDTSSSRHYVCCLLNIYSNNGPKSEQESAREKIPRRYSQKSINSVWRLCVAQVVLGLLMLGCQVPASYWQFMIWSNAGVTASIAYTDHATDITGPGIWAGLFAFATGVVGLVSVKKNARCLIIAHLVMSAIAILFTIALVAFCVFNLSSLVDCKVNGVWTRLDDTVTWRRDYDRDRSYYDDSDYYWRHTSTTVAPTTTSTEPPFVELLGERFGPKTTSQFYCMAGIFSVWIALESVMVVTALLAFTLSIFLIVKSSKALCICCRRCCTVENNEDDASLLS